MIKKYWTLVVKVCKWDNWGRRELVSIELPAIYDHEDLCNKAQGDLILNKPWTNADILDTCCKKRAIQVEN